MTSPSFKIDGVGIKKVGKGALIAGAGAALVYILEAIPGLDFGGYTALVGGILAILVNFLRKLIVSYE